MIRIIYRLFLNLFLHGIYLRDLLRYFGDLSSLLYPLISSAMPLLIVPIRVRSLLTFYSRFPVIGQDAAFQPGYRTTAVAKFLHPSGQQVLIVFPHIGIRKVNAAAVQEHDFTSDLSFRH